MQQLKFQEESDETLNNMFEPVSTSTGAAKGFGALASSLIGLTVFWTEFGEVIKLATVFVAFLTSSFLLGCGIYDRFFKKHSKPRFKHRPIDKH